MPAIALVEIMTRHDTWRWFLTTSGGLVTPALAGCLGGGGADGDVTDAVSLFDAGTEPNAEPPGTGPDRTLAQDAPDQGADEGGTVRRLGRVDDGHDYPAVEDVVQVTVTPT